MTIEDVSSLIASIRNALEKGKFLLVTAKLVELKKLLEEFHLQKLVDSLIHDVAEVSRTPKTHQDVTIVEKKLDEIDVHVSQYRQL